MAVPTNPTLADWGKETSDGVVMKMIDMYSTVNEMLIDMVVVESNTTVGEKAVIEDGIPEVAWRQLNQGVVPSTDASHPILFTPGIMEGYGQVDEELVNMYEDKAGYRVRKNRKFIEAMSQEGGSKLIYGDQKVNPEQITGLAAFYSDATTAASKANIIKGGGSGVKNTSMYLVVWGEEKIAGFFPKGTKAGIQHEDKGLQKVTQTGNKILYMWEDQYKWRLGLAVYDWRYACRMCNIDIDALLTTGKTTDTSANLLDMMIESLNTVHDLNGRAAFYCNRTVKTALDKKALNKATATLTIDTLENGKPITKFLGYPIRRVDALLNSEGTVV
jgi:hypothetical protein